MSQDHFSENVYMVRRKMMKLLGGAYHVYGANEQVVAYADQKAFKLKEDIKVYTSEEKSQELFSIKARQVIDFSAAYDVVDSQTNQKIGALQRKGMKSILKDEWIVMDANDQEIALIKEDSALMATLRRFLSNLIPQQYGLYVGEEEIVNMTQNFNPFVYKLVLDFSKDTEGKFDKRLVIAGGILLAAIEGKQN